MKRAFIITGITAVALAGTTLTASAYGKERGEGPRGPRISFEEFDANSDGQVTAEEIQAHFQARFEAADTDGDGNLSAEELSARAEGERAERMQQRLQRMIERRDTDGNGVLSMEEMQPKGQGAMFSRLDADENGSISAEEFAKLRHRDGDGHERGGQQFGHKGGQKGGGDCEKGGQRHGHDH